MRTLWITITSVTLGLLVMSCGGGAPGQRQVLPPANVVDKPMPAGQLGTVAPSGVDLNAARPPPPDFSR